jgi:thiamine-phosphate pyrophosphorylase
VLSYYITDRTQFPGTESERQSALLRTIRAATAAGVDYIQLREKDLPVRDVELFAREALNVIRNEGPTTFLINHRTDVAVAIRADGVHLTGSDIPSSDARALAATAGTDRFIVAASCHSARELRLAEAHGADFAVLAPIFEKMGVSNGVGLAELRQATQKDFAPDLRVEAGNARSNFPVFALGGVNLEHARLCAASGAFGIAGIRIFQQCDNLDELVRSIRSL